MATIGWEISATARGGFRRSRKVVGAMDPTEKFFEELGRRAYEPLLAKTTGTVHFEVMQGMCTQHWYLRVHNGVIGVSRENIEADAVVRLDRQLFDRAASGTENIMAALLRGEIDAEGDIPLLILVERLFPGPQTPSGRRSATSGGQAGHG